MATAGADLTGAADPADDSGVNRERADARHLQIVTVAGIATGLTAIVFIAREKAGAAFAFIAASGLALGAGAALVGALLGFLFGVPKTGLLGAALAKRTQTDGKEDAAGPGGYTPNTALEEISDWLTKILVGVGLTQLLAIRGAMGALASKLTTQNLPGVSLVAVMIYFAVFGFIAGYAWTRVVLAPMFKRADGRLNDIVEEVQQKTRRLHGLIKEGAMVKAEVVSNQMAAGLYDAQNPAGYQQAIRDAAALLAAQGDPKTFTFWSNLAAAQGQRAEAAKAIKDDAEFQLARRDALEAARKAITYDTTNGTAKGWIRLMLDGSVPEENDLIVFKNDQEFQDLVQ